MLLMDSILSSDSEHSGKARHGGEASNHSSGGGGGSKCPQLAPASLKKKKKSAGSGLEKETFKKKDRERLRKTPNVNVWPQ